MKKYFIRTVVLVIAAWMSYPMHAQRSDTLDIRREENGKIRFVRFATNSDSNRRMSNDTIFLKSILQAKQEDEFRLKSETTDELGITHKRFQQYYKGIKVENAEYLLHDRVANTQLNYVSLQKFNS